VTSLSCVALTSAHCGYSGYATALVACSSVLTLLIPPSIPMIVLALTSGLPVSACFLSIVGPDLIFGQGCSVL